MSNELDKRPDPLQIPSVEWMLHQLSDHGDDAGADFNDGNAINGYFGWSVDDWKNSASGKLIRRELEVWWEPNEEPEDLPAGEKQKRHIRRFLITEITGQRGAESVEADL